MSGLPFQDEIFPNMTEEEEETNPAIFSHPPAEQWLLESMC